MRVKGLTEVAPELMPIIGRTSGQCLDLEALGRIAVGHLD